MTHDFDIQLIEEFDFELYGVWTAHQSLDGCEVYHHKPDCIVLISNTAEIIEYRPSKQRMLMLPDSVPQTQRIILLTPSSGPDHIPF